MLVTIYDWVIPGFIFFPVVLSTLFTVGLSVALWLDEKLEK